MPPSRDDNAPDFHQVFRDLVLSGATATITSSTAAPGAQISVSVFGQALGDIQLLLARCHGIAPAPAPSLSQRMEVRPIQLNVLSSVPTVEVRASTLTQPVCVDVTLRPHVHDRLTYTASRITHRLGNITLSNDDPVVRIGLPADAFSAGPQS